MIIKTLVENTSISDKFNNEHGLSLYIETKKHKILFDLGKSNLFLENAEKMDVDVEDIDIIIISHGHYDHGRGLKTFIDMNNKAKIYINKNAFNPYFSIKENKDSRYIGLDKTLEANHRIIFTDEYMKIDEGLEVFSKVQGKELLSKANKALFAQEENQLIQDDFSHEQNLIITEGNKTILFGGCAHNGIVNIVKEFISLKKEAPSYVLSGFHLFNPSADISEDYHLVDKIGSFLLETNSIYYTGHCTGLTAYHQLKEKMNDKINYLATGSIFKL